MGKLIEALLKGMAKSVAPWILLWAGILFMIGLGIGFFVAWLVL